MSAPHGNPLPGAAQRAASLAHTSFGGRPLSGTALRAALPDPDDATARWILLGDDDPVEPAEPVAELVRIGDGAVHRLDAEAAVAHVRERRGAGRGGWLASVTASTLGADHLGDATILLAADPALRAAALLQGTADLATAGPARLLRELGAALDPSTERIAVVASSDAAAERLGRVVRRAGVLEVRRITVPGTSVAADPEALDALESALFDCEATVVVLALPLSAAAPLVLLLRDVLPEAWFVTVPPPVVPDAASAEAVRDAAVRSARRLGAGVRLMTGVAGARRARGGEAAPAAPAPERPPADFPGWD